MKDEFIHIRIEKAEKEKYHKLSENKKYSSLGEFIREVLRSFSKKMKDRY